jgi:hypothetical protein
MRYLSRRNGSTALSQYGPSTKRCSGFIGANTNVVQEEPRFTVKRTRTWSLPSWAYGTPDAVFQANSLVSFGARKYFAFVS